MSSAFVGEKGSGRFLTKKSEKIIFA